MLAPPMGWHLGVGVQRKGRNFQYTFHATGLGAKRHDAVLLLPDELSGFGPETVFERLQLPETNYWACGCTNTLVLPLYPAPRKRACQSPLIYGKETATLDDRGMPPAY
jgi:hypothetical protein